jgi:hypothetical protein
MNTINGRWVTWAATATWAVFIVLCLVSIDNSRLSILSSKQRIQLSQLGLASIAPDNLPRAAEIFRTSLPVQDHQFPVNEMTRLPAWSTLQGTLSAYAQRLKLLDAQQQELDRHLQQRSLLTTDGMLASIIAAAILSVLSRRTRGTQ